MKAQARIIRNHEVQILIAEDSPTQAEQLRYLLAEAGYRVAVTTNGKQALDLALKRPPSLVITDVMMPEMDGLELCKRIKSDVRLKDTPVVLLTSLSSLLDVMRGLECGADSFLRKPCEAKTLLGRIEYILVNRRLRQEHKVEVGFTLEVRGRKHFINSEREQILDLLVSTYEEAIRINQELQNRQGQLARSYQSLKALYGLAAGLNTAANVSDVAEKALLSALQLPEVRAGWIFLRDEGKGFRLAACGGLPPGVTISETMEPSCSCLEACLSGEMRETRNIAPCERLRTHDGDEGAIGSHASIPLWSSHRTLGVMNLVREGGGVFSEGELKTLNGVGNQVGTALERAELLEELERKVADRTLALTAEIEERIRVEEALRKSEQQFRLLLDSTAEAIYGTDLEGRCTFCNPASLRLLGYSHANQLLGQNMHTLSHHSRPDGTPLPADECRIYQAVQRGEGVQADDEVLWRADGTCFPAEYRSHPVRQDHEVVGTVVAFLDITERKRAEEALRQSEAEYRSLVEGAPYGIYRAAADGKLLSVNPALVEMLGYVSEEELLAVNLAGDVYLDAAERVQAVDKTAGIQPFRGVEVKWKRKDGKIITVRRSGRPVHNEQGRFLYVEVMAEDVTELKLLEQQLRQAQKMEAVGQLAGGVAHDFNNLLGVILGYSGILMDKLHPTDPLRKRAEGIQKAAERAVSVTRQLLAFSRRQVLQPKVLDLNAIVTDMEDMLRRLIGEDIELAIVRCPQPARVKADRGQIEQVIMNLAINARDAMPQGGKLTIQTTNVELDRDYARFRAAVQPGPYVMLAVNDTGIGMDAETQARIFEPFFTTKGVSKGTGLGLATVYGIVKQSGGNIWVYSEPGHGTTFKVYLPRVEETAPAENLSKAAVAPLRGSETVLLVEDEESLRKLTREFLEDRGYTVQEAQNGNEALEIAGRHQGPIHLMMTDVVMPGISGRELAQRIEALRPDAKVLYMSGYTDDAIIRHGVLEPGAAFLQKPFRPDELAQKVREILDAPPKAVGGFSPSRKGAKT